MSAPKLCTDCKWCSQDRAKCAAVIDPTNGNPMPVQAARRDAWEGYLLPCGYAGALWVAKT